MKDLENEWMLEVGSADVSPIMQGHRVLIGRNSAFHSACDVKQRIGVDGYYYDADRSRCTTKTWSMKDLENESVLKV